MKRIILLLGMFILSVSIFAQKDKKDETTKMEDFVSKTGVVLKFQDYNMSPLKLKYDIAKTNIRKIENGNEVAYFYEIINVGNYDTKKASIAYEDLLELIKALDNLESSVESDIAKNPDYLENKFVTDDGVQLGYYVENKKVTWYIVLEKYGSGNTIFIKEANIIRDSFNSAKQKIEELKN